MSRIRRFSEEDISQVAALRRRCFKQSAHESEASLGDYIRSVFIGHPWPNEEFPSLVSEAKSGAINGFIGVLPRPARYLDENVWIAVSSQFMVDPDSSGLVALRLLKSFLQGPQALSLADQVNENSRKIWESLGGVAVAAYELNWKRPLVPRIVAGGSRRLAGASPGTLLDRSLRKMPRGKYRIEKSALAGSCEDVDVGAFISCLEQVSRHFKFYPLYEQETLAWLLARLREDPGIVDVLSKRVLAPDGQVVGAYVLTINDERVAQVIQLFAEPDASAAVFNHACFEAWQHGALELAGRLQPETDRVVRNHPVNLAPSTPSLMIDTDLPDLREHILSGAALLSRLEGEWWLRF